MYYSLAFISESSLICGITGLGWKVHILIVDDQLSAYIIRFKLF